MKQRSKNKLILHNLVSLKYREINKISYESKMSKVFELSFIFMQLNRNVNTVFFYAVVPVSHGKEYFKCLRRQAFFVTFSIEKREKKA